MKNEIKRAVISVVIFAVIYILSGFNMFIITHSYVFAFPCFDNIEF